VRSPAALTPQAEDFPRWYQDVVAKAELADNGPVRGTMVVRPYGYAIWERMQAELDQRIKALGVANAYFPLFIPESYLRREASHVEGFSPELAVVTHGGGKRLEEPVVVRPTSETIINAFFAKWIQSHRDLPLLVNQWANVVRWELRPRLFLRTTEFLWQEGHTAHATKEEARAFALRVLEEVYRAFMVEVLALPVLVGRKTPAERFPGADESWTCEAMMRDGKALQMGTSHELGQRFARMFGIEFQTERGDTQLVWQTSWGVSTRLVGALVMGHGDDAGLRLPPRLAPLEAVVVVVRDDAQVLATAERLAEELRGLGRRVALDRRVDSSYGRRVTDWELKGVPLRLELGPRDLQGGVVTAVRRDTGARLALELPTAAREASDLLDAIQAQLLEEGRAFLAARTVEVGSPEEAAEAGRDGFARLAWARLGPEGEAELARKGLSVRCLVGPAGEPPFGTPEEELVAVVGRAY
jgi:prolyl-tRNA synthetase